MEQTERTTRRGVLAAAAGGAAALAVSALARPGTALAGVDGDIVIDANNGGSGTTILNSTGEGATAFRANATAGSGGGVGIWGPSSSANGRGVIGIAAGGGRGVSGESPSGWGVYGRTDFGQGVRGVGPSAGAIGVYGESGHGTAIRARTVDGIALHTEGRIVAQEVSGVARIRAGRKSVTVTPGVAVTTSSFVLLTPKADIGAARCLWFTTSPANGTITIRLSSARSTGTPVAWLLLG